MRQVRRLIGCLVNCREPGVKQLQDKDIHDDDDFVWGLVVCVCALLLLAANAGEEFRKHVQTFVIVEHIQFYLLLWVASLVLIHKCSM